MVHICINYLNQLRYHTHLISMQTSHRKQPTYIAITPYLNLPILSNKYHILLYLKISKFFIQQFKPFKTNIIKLQAILKTNIFNFM